LRVEGEKEKSHSWRVCKKEVGKEAISLLSEGDGGLDIKRCLTFQGRKMEIRSEQWHGGTCRGICRAAKN